MLLKTVLFRAIKYSFIQFIHSHWPVRYLLHGSDTVNNVSAKDYAYCFACPPLIVSKSMGPKLVVVIPIQGRLFDRDPCM